MLKDAIRSLVGNSDKMSMVMGGQMQLAGVSVVEQKALLGELKQKGDKKDNYLFVWN
ncbi:competence pheromone ComX [Paenibacillus sp. GCM10023252]|uniref:competence pheromone ComX n=1 Tax=Paenibacillus sp. GCM10023252 TaxID=3252649 RepID=UPI00361C0F98